MRNIKRILSGILIFLMIFSMSLNSIQTITKADEKVPGEDNRITAQSNTENTQDIKEIYENLLRTLPEDERKELEEYTKKAEILYNNLNSQNSSDEEKQEQIEDFLIAENGGEYRGDDYELLAAYIIMAAEYVKLAGIKTEEFLYFIGAFRTYLASIEANEVKVEKPDNAPTDMNSKNWMKYLPNTVALSSLNIPGTHDTGCYKFIDLGELVTTTLVGMAKTQRLSLSSQLDAGARLLDIRYARGGGALSSAKDDLIINHGGITVLDDITMPKFLRLEDVIYYVRKFLSENPSETVIMAMKVEDSEAKGYLDTTSDKFNKLKDDFYASMEASPDAIILKKGDPMPTLGEARGKMVLIPGGTIDMVDDEYEVDADGKINGSGKYKGLKKEFDEAEALDYTKTIDSVDYNLDHSPKYTGTNCYQFTPFPVPAFQALDVIKFLNSYEFKKGKYYGWIRMDFFSEGRAQKIYQSNIFDFDENGGPVTYISDISYAYEQDWKTAAECLEQKGYTVLPMNFNQDGADKPFSSAIVNGRKNNGSFNIAIGYKTTTDPMNAITGLKWYYRRDAKAEDEEDKKKVDEYNQKTDKMISDANYNSIQSVSKLESVEGGNLPKLSDEICSINIGTGGYNVVLCSSKDPKAGNPFTTLEALQIYRKTDGNVKKRATKESEKKLTEYIDNKFASPRDVDGNMFACNYGRNQIDDVLLFYKTTFPQNIPVKEQDNKEQILPITATITGTTGYYVTTIGVVVLIGFGIYIFRKRKKN